MRTLSIDVTNSPFATEHARVLEHHTDGAALTPPEGLRERYEPSVRESAVETWRERMVNEHRSSSVFAGLLPQLIEASCGIDVQTTVLRAATDELVHAVLCGEVVRALGGEPVARAEPTLTPVPAHARLAPLERVMRNVLFVGCLAETVAVGLITEERELATEPFIKATLSTILADEVQHARLGWLFVPAALTQLGDDARARTSAYLRTAFAYLERRELAVLHVSKVPSRELEAQREAVGLCSGPGARELFYATVTGVLVPRLDALGLEATAAWRERDEHAREA